MVNKKELASLVNQPAEVRFEYTVKRVADFAEVWVIEDEEGGILLGDEAGNLIYPIWPFEEYAQIFCTGDYANCKVRSIEIHNFLENEIPELEKGNYKLSLFPLNTGKGMVVEIGHFVEAVQWELDQIE